MAGFERDVDFDRPHLYYDDHRLSPNHRIGTTPFGKYRNVQYHVGHLVPNEAINRQFGRLAQMETFFMSNMSPQRKSLNEGVWSDLENKIRNIKDTNKKDHVWIINGPIFGDKPNMLKRPGGQRVPIPDSYFCICVDPFSYPWDEPANVDIACFIIPQNAKRGTPLDDFHDDLAVVEDATNLRFFPGWPQRSSAVARSSSRTAIGAADKRHRLLRQLY